MKIYAVFLFSLMISIVVSEEIDYYWRNYYGDVPIDAVEAGMDTSGSPIYVGQGYFPEVGLLPATLHSGSSNMKITANKKVYSTSKYVKILCSRHAYAMNWVQVKYSDIATLTDVHLVVGGTESDSIVHIGRARHEGELEIGKIYNLAPYQGLALPNRERSESTYQTFDVLTYRTNLIDLNQNVNQ